MKRSRLAVCSAWILTAASFLSAAGMQNRKTVPYFQVTDEITFEESGERVTYTLFAPQSLTSGKLSPLILALHFGGGVTPTYGKDFTEILVLPALGELKAIIVAPNCPGRGWRDPKSEAAVLKILEKVKGRFAIDGKKALVVGFSMGAIGAYYFVAKHPGLFSAAVVVAGKPDEEDIAGLKDVPFYIIHSEEDQIFPIHDARLAFDKLRANRVTFSLNVVRGVTHFETVNYVPSLRKAVPWIRKIWKSRG